MPVYVRGLQKGFDDCFCRGFRCFHRESSKHRRPRSHANYSVLRPTVACLFQVFLGKCFSGYIERFASSDGQGRIVS